MSEHPRVSHPLYNLLPMEIEGFYFLAELALDRRSSWNHANDEVWRQLDPELWAITHNCWVVLQTVSRDQIHEDNQRALCLLFNAGVESADFHLPPTPNGAWWHLAVDTSCEAPQGVAGAGDEPLLNHSRAYQLSPRSSVMLLARPST